MVRNVSGRSKLGLPVLREKTYLDYRNRIFNFDSRDKAMEFFNEAFFRIKNADPLRARFVRDTSQMYPSNDRDVAYAELITGFELLALEGELPKLDEKKFEKQWEATMNRSVVVLNVGAYMDVILADNPIYWQFIMDSTQFFLNEQRMNIMSDHSCGYMFLAHNRRK